MWSTQKIMVDITSHFQALQSLAGDLSKAPSVRERIKLAAPILAALAACEEIVEQFVVSGTVADATGRTRARYDERLEHSKYHDPGPKQFKGMKLAEIGRILLKERGELHGKQIERLAKAGGFKSSGKSFQGYLAVAFRREGGFENLGKNRWHLNSAIKAEREYSEPSRATEANHAAVNGISGLSQKMKLHAWLSQNGPASRSEVVRGAGVPEGTASSYLSVEKDLFENRDGKWYAR
jgi:hypothetical protein